MDTCRSILATTSDKLWAATFDDRPSKLFNGMHHARLAILLASCQPNGHQPAILFVTPYNKWSKEERDFLFNRLKFVAADIQRPPGFFPKIGTPFEIRIMRRLESFQTTMETYLSHFNTKYKLFYKITGVGSWFTITQRPPRFFRGTTVSSSTREAEICFDSSQAQRRAFCTLNSSLFYWLYQVRTNCRDFNPSDYRTFPVPDSLISENFDEQANHLSQQLDQSSSLVSASHTITGEIEYEQFRPRLAKSTLDEIDQILAKHYGFTEEELDFIINYDIKYRMGQGTGEDEGE